MATDRVAPPAAASSVARWMRACSPSNPELGTACGGPGIVTSSGIRWTSCTGCAGRSGALDTGAPDTGLLDTFASTIASSHPAITSVTAAMAVSTVSGRARIGLLRTFGKRAWAGRIAICPGHHAEVRVRLTRFDPHHVYHSPAFLA